MLNAFLRVKNYSVDQYDSPFNKGFLTVILSLSFSLLPFALLFLGLAN